MYCDRPVMLHVCRGRNRDPVKAAQNKGYWYEACTQPQPEGPHFHRWRYDLPRQQISDNSNSDSIFSEMSPSQFSLQDLLNIPITPESSPVSSTFNLSPFPTPTRRLVAAPTPTYSYLPFNPASNFSGIGSSAIIPGSTPVTITRAPPNDNHPHTWNAINPYTGKPMVACNGPICRLNRAKANAPTRNSSKCVHQFCKRCCVYFQESGHGGKCPARTHDAPRRDLAPDIQSEGPSNNVISHTPNVPDDYSVASEIGSSRLPMTESGRERIEKRLLNLGSLEYL
ncbi:hypothetical protein HYPSUDRAFT_1075616 [Hypholoma sublateritium FD-334 SS-4]|uniref:Uncharacterized protein n=1 Tax=Hypholoma sublateritium (strain FD-334 SS-4) TaxID=945553 RepID=A0A0D2PL68_HYPSF|nr:hypothetical protein HYPSUDRAFT_1075616 [Hypholoma sublateritium FD-334 SS-4]